MLNWTRRGYELSIEHFRLECLGFVFYVPLETTFRMSFQMQGNLQLFVLMPYSTDVLFKTQY